MYVAILLNCTWITFTSEHQRGKKVHTNANEVCKRSEATLLLISNGDSTKESDAADVLRIAGKQSKLTMQRAYGQNWCEEENIKRNEMKWN